MERRDNERTAGIDGYLFRLIATFEAAAMQQLGKIAHPLTGDVEVNLEGASDSIEMLVAIQRKTEGNLNIDESRLLEHVLYQLRMNFVDVAEEQKKGSGGSAESGDGDEGKKPGDEEEKPGDEEEDTADRKTENEKTRADNEKERS